ncbi:MAG TPA: TonB-dependent receptor [Lunatimonas sp.]|nr:TonB-dependent receptor [Lunatimonas sp.]
MPISGFANGKVPETPPLEVSESLLEIERDKPLFINVTGKIISSTDSQGIPGVSVLVKGTSIGTVSDVEGNYAIDIPPGENILVFSSIGYVPQEIEVNERTVIDIVLSEDPLGLEEVVVVGYGTRKRVNLTGSVASVGSEALEKRTVPKSSMALQGQMSGISVRQGSGNPGKNSASLLIRGQGTFSSAGNAPLVLVDMIEASLDDVDPNDIESVSVLKDAASAAIFGSKAANGVILIETKKGKSGTPVFRYNAYVSTQSPTMIPEMLNSWEYGLAVNENNRNLGQQRRYTDEEIELFRAGTDPAYPNFDHIGYLFGSGRGVETKHDLSVSGGTAETQYMFSLGYYDQQGIIKKNNADRINLRLNLDSKLSDRLSVSIKLAGNKNSTNEPSAPYGNGGIGNIIAGAMRNANAIPGFTEDGLYGRNETLHPEADLNSQSFVSGELTSIYSNGSLVWKITDDLKITGQAGYTQNLAESKTFIAKYPITSSYAIQRNSLRAAWNQSTALTLQSFLEYNKTLDNHSIQVLLGRSAQAFGSKYLGGFRDEFPNNEIYELDAGATVRATNTGGAARNTLSSYFGRLNYAFDDKYLIEANFRYDGSSRFPEDRRWGLFPSFSAGWRLSQEGFFQNALPWVSDLKIRGSWGKLGNQSVANYPYQDLITLGQNYPFGDVLMAGGAVTRIANRQITWETTTMTNIGIDLSLLENRLAFSAEYFVKTTDDILYPVSVSTLLGATPSESNAAKVENKGWDFDLSYRNSIGEFTYGVSAIFSVVRNQVLELANLERDIPRGLFVGHPIGSRYGFVSDGLFVNEEEILNYATQPFNNLAIPGGIKYVDISGPNGVPDGVVNATYDRTVIGQPLPITTYALTLNGAFRNFDFNLMVQGEGGRNAFVTLGQFFFPLENNSNVQRDMYENRWTPENPDPNALYPTIIATAAGFYNSNPVDFWNRDATFLRLKNAQIGYTLPGGLIGGSFLDNVRFYLTGENLFTITKFYKGWDPEMQTGGADWFYPLVRSYVAGVNVRF